jgi:hypothetical protein
MSIADQIRQAKQWIKITIISDRAQEASKAVSKMVAKNEIT